MPGVILDIEEVSTLPFETVSVSGTVKTLWESSSPKIAQVGLIEDESGVIKFTSWTKSNQRWVTEGETVRVMDARKNWYEGRCSLALTSESRIEFPDRERRWWED